MAEGAVAGNPVLLVQLHGALCGGDTTTIGVGAVVRDAGSGSVRSTNGP